VVEEAPVPTSLKDRLNIKHREVEIEDDLDIPTFLRKRQ